MRESVASRLPNIKEQFKMGSDDTKLLIYAEDGKTVPIKLELPTKASNFEPSCRSPCISILKVVFLFLFITSVGWTSYGFWMKMTGRSVDHVEQIFVRDNTGGKLILMLEEENGRTYPLFEESKNELPAGMSEFKVTPELAVSANEPQFQNPEKTTANVFFVENVHLDAPASNSLFDSISNTHSDRENVEPGSQDPSSVDVNDNLPKAFEVLTDDYYKNDFIRNLDSDDGIVDVTNFYNTRENPNDISTLVHKLEIWKVLLDEMKLRIGLNLLNSKPSADSENEFNDIIQDNPKVLSFDFNNEELPENVGDTLYHEESQEIPKTEKSPLRNQVSNEPYVNEDTLWQLISKTSRPRSNYKDLPTDSSEEVEGRKDEYLFPQTELSVDDLVKIYLSTPLDVHEEDTLRRFDILVAIIHPFLQKPEEDNCYNCEAFQEYYDNVQLLFNDPNISNFETNLKNVLSLVDVKSQLQDQLQRITNHLSMTIYVSQEDQELAINLTNKTKEYTLFRSINN